MIHVDLDRPRTFQFSFEAAKRFRAIRGFEVLEIIARMRSQPESAFDLFADAIWCGLPASGRAEITREDVRGYLDMSKLMGIMRQLSPAPHNS